MNDSFKKLAKPYQIWLYVLALFPVIIMFLLTFMRTEGISFTEASLSFSSYEAFTQNDIWGSIITSFRFAAITTFATLILGYLVAYRIFRSKFKNKFLILVILILPMWSNILLRTVALGNIMEPNNMITDLLSKIGIEAGINIIGTEIAVLIGLIITYMPFMILPIYTSLEKIDYSLEEAAIDLGATDFKKFWKVIVPLSSKGIVTGSILVFLPSMSGFAIPEILGAGRFQLVGNIIEREFRNMDYNLGSLLAIIVLILILGSLFIINKVDKEGELLL